MIRPGLILLLIITLSQAYGQESEPNYYAYTQETFRDSKSFNETIELAAVDLKRLNAVVFYLTNEQRVKHNLPVLAYHEKLEAAATIHCESMKKDKFFDHINPKSRKLRDPNDRARVVGIENPYLSENIIESFILQYSAGEEVYPGPKGVFRYKPGEAPIEYHTYLSLGERMIKDWMNSPNHRKNILDKKAEQLGCSSAFYLRSDFNDMPVVLSTQNFQLHELIRVIE